MMLNSFGFTCPDNDKKNGKSASLHGQFEAMLQAIK
jgi:hypothetical protein